MAADPAASGRLRLVFMGTADFAVPSLDAMIAGRHEVAAVYTQPPRPAGRGQQPRPSPVQRAAERHGLPVRTPRTLRDPAAQAEFAALEPDAAVVAAYGLILPKPILDAPRLGCVNVHGSLLPRWRGAAPIQRAILAGDPETGVCLMRMDEGLDTGPVYACERVPITATTTAQTLHDDLARLGAAMLPPLLDDLAAGRARAEPQPAEGATYAAKIDKAEGRLDWRCPAAALDRQVRALNPWPGCWTELPGGERLNVLAAEPAPAAAAAEPGTLLDDRLLVACAEGALRLTRVQRPGRRPLDADAYLRGSPLPAGARLPCPATS